MNGVLDYLCVVLHLQSQLHYSLLGLSEKEVHSLQEGDNYSVTHARTHKGSRRRQRFPGTLMKGEIPLTSTHHGRVLCDHLKAFGVSVVNQVN